MISAPAVERKALLIAVEQYDDPAIKRLNSPLRDARLLAETLEDKAIGPYLVEGIAGNPERREFSILLSRFLSGAAPTDRILIHIACHGIVDLERNLYFAAKDSRKDDAAATAVPADDLSRWVAQSRCQQVLVLLDCCFGARAFTQSLKPTPVFHEVGQGKAIIASSDALQYAYEPSDGSPSYFTGALIDGLRTGAADVNGDGLVSVDDLYQYVFAKLEQRGKDQLPRLFSDIVKPHLVIARSPQGPRRTREDRYKEDVLEPAVKSDGRPTKDIVRRYQLTDPNNANKVRDDVEWVREHWELMQESLLYNGVVRILKREHSEEYHRLFDPLDIATLAAAIERSREDPETGDASASDRVLRAAGPWQIISEASLRALESDGTHTRRALIAAVDSLGVTVAPPADLPIIAPVPQLPDLQKFFMARGHRHLLDFFFGHDVDLGDGIAVEPTLTIIGRQEIALDPETLEAFTMGPRRPDPEDTEAWAVVRRLSVCTAADLSSLLVWELVQSLRAARDRGARPKDLLDHAISLGLAEREARRLAYSVDAEHPGLGNDVERRLRALIDAGKVAGAHHSIAGMPDERRSVQTRGAFIWIDRRIEEAARLCDQARQAASSKDAWAFLDRAALLVPDHPDLADIGANFPPPPPTSVRATTDGIGILVSWDAAASGLNGVRYAVSRGGQPQSIDHLVEDDILDTTVRDQTIPVNVPLWYAVTASRNGVSAVTAVVDGPVCVRPEVAGLTAVVEDGRVLLRWKRRPEARDVVIRRGAGRPTTPDDTTIIVEGNAYDDIEVENGVTYHYLVASRYRRPNGPEVATAGVGITATPGAVPQPVDLQVEPVPGNARQIMVHVSRPAEGTVEIIGCVTRPSHRQGITLDRTLLDDLGPVLASIPSGGMVVMNAPARPLILLAVTVVGDRATIGKIIPYAPIPEITSIRQERRGDYLFLSWVWPTDLPAVELRWSQTDGKSGEQIIPRARFQDDGAAVLEVSGAEVEVRAWPTLNVFGQQYKGRPVTLRVPACPVVLYRLHWREDRGGRWPARARATALTGVTVEAHQTVSLRRLVLVVRTGEYQPLRAEHGDIAKEWTDLTLRAGESVFLACVVAPPASSWVRCFAPGSRVDLRDPPVASQRTAIR